MTEYMLLLHDRPTAFEGLAPEDMQQIIAKYSAWREQLQAKGKFVDGKKLTDDGGKWLSREEGVDHIIDGPYSEAKEVIGGYFTIRAENQEEALALARECPHLAYGRIELRAVDPV
jgi:hypothetical protein